MTITPEILTRLAALHLSTEQMAEILGIIAEVEAPQQVLAAQREERLRKDRARKIRGNSTDVPRKFHGNSTENGLARVEDKPLEIISSETPKIKTPPLPPQEPKGFAEFWGAYPKRDGDPARKAAVKAYRAALNRASHETIMDCVKAYAAEMKQRGRIGSEFVKQARTWLNSDPWLNRQTTEKPLLVVRPILKDTPEFEEMKLANGGRLAALPLHDPDTKQYLGEGTWKYGQ